jgi:hypothetical protein
MRKSADQGDGDAPNGVWGYWPIVVPVLPVLFAIGMMEFVGVPADVSLLGIGDWATSAVGTMRHTADRINYGSAVAIHTGVCVGAALYFAVMLHRIVTSGRLTLCVMMTCMFAGVMGLMVLLAQVDPKLAVYRMSYFYIEEVLSLSRAAPDLTTETLFGVKRLVFAALFPSVIGIACVVLAGGVAYAVLRRIGDPSQDGWAGAFRANIAILYRCFYTLSAVLVTSTAAALLFYKLPAGVMPASDDLAGIAAALAAYTGSAGTFWGAIYTLTLLSVFAGPFAVLFVRARRHVLAQPDGPELRDWLSANGVDTTVAQTLKNVAVVLAPLLVGPLGDIARGVA